MTGETGKNYEFVTASGWYINIAELIPLCNIQGTATAPILTTASDINVEVGEGIRVFADVFSVGGQPDKYHTRFYATLLYRSVNEGQFYEQSDPFFKLFLSATGEGLCPMVLFKFEFDLARLSKLVCGFKVYIAIKADDEIAGNLANWPDNPEDYVALAIETGEAIWSPEVSFFNLDTGNSFYVLYKNDGTSVYT